MYIILLLLSLVAAADVGDSFESILSAQGQALEKMDREARKSLMAFGLGEFISELSFSKSGLLGMSALKSSAGIEVKWRRTDAPLIADDKIDFEVTGKLLPEDLNSLVQVIMNLFTMSGDVGNILKVRRNLLIALRTVNDHINDIHANQYKKWKADSLRVDLHFGLGATIFYVVTPGANFRVRLNWKLADMPLRRVSQVSETYQTKFVIKTLNELDAAMEETEVKNFDLTKVLIGMGASQKKKIFTIWNVNVGFIGWLGFVPRAQVPVHEVEIPEEILNEDFEIGGDDEVDEKYLRGRRLPARKFRTGMQASLTAAARLAERSGSSRNGNWVVDEIKTMHEISKTGMFGFGTTIKSGVVEIDFKRKASSIPQQLSSTANVISILGFDGRRTRITKVPAAQYIKTLTETKRAFDSQAIASLRALTKRPTWNMTKLSLGIGTKGEIGLGPWSLGKAVKQRFFYYSQYLSEVPFELTMKSSLGKRANDYSAALENGDVLQWNQFVIRSIIELGVSIPYVLNASVNPEVEFYFEKYP